MLKFPTPFKMLFKNRDDSSAYNLYFAAFIFFHVFIWTIIPALTRSNMHLDTLEAISWGQEWQLGYRKHPPLSAWVAQIIMIIFHKQAWAGYLLSQICIALAFSATWLLGKSLLSSSSKALMATLLLEGVYYYNFTSTEFNTNILMMALWPWAIYYFWRSLNENKIYQWLMLGLLLGLLVLTKYFALMLILSISALLLYDKKYRRYLKTAGPYLAADVFLIVIFGHFIWLVNNDFPTIEYMLGRSAIEYHLYNHLLIPLSFTAAQLLSMAFALIIFFSAFYKEIKFKFQNSDEKSRFLIFMFFGPFIFTILPSLLTASKMKDMWGSPLCGLCGLMLFYFFNPKLSAKNQKKFYIALGLVVLIAISSYSASNLLAMVTKERRNSFNGKNVADLVTKKWHEYSNDKLPIVVGDIWLGSNISFFSPDSPKVFIDMDPKTAPWISYKDLGKKGGVIVWDINDEGQDLPEKYQNKIHSKILIQEPILISPSVKKYQNQEPFKLGIAIIPPFKSKDCDD